MQKHGLYGDSTQSRVPDKCHIVNAFRESGNSPYMQRTSKTLPTEEKTTPQPWQEQEPRESCATGKEKDALKWLGYCEPDERPMEFFFDSIAHLAREGKRPELTRVDSPGSET